MNDPENQILRILSEFRNGFREFKAEAMNSFAQIKAALDRLTRALGGKTVLGQYAAAEVEQRLTAIEKPVSALEGR